MTCTAVQCVALPDKNTMLLNESNHYGKTSASCGSTAAQFKVRVTVKFGKDIKKKNTSKVPVKYLIPHWNTESKLVIFFIILIVLVIIIPLLVFVCHPY